MTTHPKRTYTPEEMLKMAQRLRSYRDCNVAAARMLESLASQLDAQKRKDDVCPECKGCGGSPYQMGNRTMFSPCGVCHGKGFVPFPNQDREVSP